MKTFNYVIATILGVMSLFQMFGSESNLEFVGGFALLITSSLFLLFAFIEERNEEISELKAQIRHYHKLLMIDDNKK
jgi:hypothetical protein